MKILYLSRVNGEIEDFFMYPFSPLVLCYFLLHLRHKTNATRQVA